MTVKTPEELKNDEREAAKKVREGIKTTSVVKEEEKEDDKSDNDETGLEDSSEGNDDDSKFEDGTDETKEEIKDNKEEIKTSEKTEADLEKEKAEAKTNSEKARIQKRIDKEVSKRKALETEVEDLKKQLAAKTGDGKFTEEDVKSEAKKLSDQTIAERDFANACSRLEKAATKIDKDFGEKIKELGADVGPIPSAMIGVLDDLDNGGQVLSHFTSDPDEYERIIGLSPTKMAVEVTKLATKLGKPVEKKISKVPPPLDTLAGNSRSDTPIKDTDPMDVWIKKRNKQVEERRKAKMS